MIVPKLFDCFASAIRDETKGKKHKGLLFTGRDDTKAEEYVQKAKTNLELCELYKRQRLDYKIWRIARVMSPYWRNSPIDNCVLDVT